MQFLCPNQAQTASSKDHAVAPWKDQPFKQTCLLNRKHVAANYIRFMCTEPSPKIFQMNELPKKSDVFFYLGTVQLIIHVDRSRFETAEQVF